MRTCSVEGCGQKHFAKTFCKKHYDQSPARKEQLKRFQKSEKYRAILKRYNATEKAKVTKRAYYKTEKYKQMKRQYQETSERYNEYRRVYQESMEGLYRYLLKGAKNRNLSVDISFERFKELRAGGCTYCEGSLPKRGAGLDRIDNSLGYLESNVVPCCTDCNQLRQDKLTPEETKELIQRLKELRGSSGSPWRQP
jgi:hypothetical protein